MKVRLVLYKETEECTKQPYLHHCGQASPMLRHCGQGRRFIIADQRRLCFSIGRRFIVADQRRLYASSQGGASSYAYALTYAYALLLRASAAFHHYGQERRFIIARPLRTSAAYVSSQRPSAAFYHCGQGRRFIIARQARPML